MTLSGILILLAERLAAPMWIAYLGSAAWYIYEIVSALTIRSAAGPLLLFSRERLAGDLFALAGTPSIGFSLASTTMLPGQPRSDR